MFLNSLFVLLWLYFLWLFYFLLCKALWITIVYEIYTENELSFI